MSNIDKFMQQYEVNLRNMMTANPEKFKWPSTMTIDIFLSKIKTSLLAGSIDKNGPVMQKTLKDLGIRNTYVALKNYLNS